LSEAIPLKEDALGRVIQTIARISNHYANSIVKSLVVWRTSMNPMAMMPLDFSGKKKAPVYVCCCRCHHIVVLVAISSSLQSWH